MFAEFLQIEMHAFSVAKCVIY